MSTRIAEFSAILLAALSAASLGCLDPTQAVVEISTDTSCSYVDSTGISAGLLGDIEKGFYDTTTSLCAANGDIGSIVLVPPDGADKDAPFAFKVVASLGAPVETSCIAPAYGPGCIVARRAMRFVPQRPFHVPVHLGRACAGVVCPDNQTCEEGVCRSATVDPYDCETSATCVPEKGDVPAWQKPITGEGPQLARDVAVDSDGTIAVVGTYDGSVDLGGGTLTSKGDDDVFVVAYSQGGNHKWSRSLGGPLLDDVPSVAIGPDGAVFVMFSFMDTIDIGGGPLKSAGSSDLAIAKFTFFGKLEWAIRLGGASGEAPGAIAVDHEGNLVAIGTFSGSAEFGNQMLTSAGNDDIFIATFTPAGNLRWAKAIGGMLDDAGSAIAVDATGGVYVSGFVAGTVEFSPEPAPDGTKIVAVGNSDGFVAGYDPTGQFRWVNSIGGLANDRVHDVAVRGERVVVTGQISAATLIQGPGMPATLSDSMSPGLVAAFDTSGALVWAEQFGSVGEGVGESVDIAADESIVIGGEIAANDVFGSNPVTLTGARHPFVGVLEREGKPRWARVYSSSTFAATSAVAATPDEFVYHAGWFSGDLDLGSKTWSAGDTDDGFLLRVAPP